MTPDGERLLFFSMRPVEGSTPLEIPDIWYVDRENDVWGEPVNAGAPVNRPESGEAYVTTTREGTLYLSSVNRGDATAGHDVYRATRVGDGYSEPEYLDLAIETRFSNPLIAPSEEFLVIDSMQGGGFGGNDLYVCFRDGTDGRARETLVPSSIRPEMRARRHCRRMADCSSSPATGTSTTSPLQRSTR